MLRYARISWMVVGAALCVSAQVGAREALSDSEALVVLRVPLGASSTSERAPSVGLEFQATDVRQRRRINTHWSGGSAHGDTPGDETPTGFKLDLDFHR